jgi:hypothetical protein
MPSIHSIEASSVASDKETRMTREEPTKESESKMRKSRKGAKEAAGGAAVLGGAAAMTASELSKNQPGEHALADPASFDAAAAYSRMGSAPPDTGAVARRAADSSSVPSPSAEASREGTTSTPGTARGSEGSSAGSGPGQDPGAEGVQSIGSTAQGDAPSEQVGDAHQDLVEVLPEGTGDVLIRAGMFGVGPAATITAADATGVLDDTQDRINEQIEGFRFDANAEVIHGYKYAEWVVDREGRRVIDQLDEGAVSDELGRAADTVGDLASDAGDAAVDAADDAGDAIGDAAEDTGDAIEDAVGDANPFD